MLLHTTYPSVVRNSFYCQHFQHHNFHQQFTKYFVHVRTKNSWLLRPYTPWIAKGFYRSENTSANDSSQIHLTDTVIAFFDKSFDWIVYDPFDYFEHGCDSKIVYLNSVLKEITIKKKSSENCFDKFKKKKKIMSESTKVEWIAWIKI